MSTIQEPAAEAEWETQPFGEGPFAETETVSEPRIPAALGFLPWTESLSPFNEGEFQEDRADETDRALGEAFAELRDEAFDEALSDLVAETEDVVGQRFSDESSASAGAAKEQLASAHLSPIQFEAENYLDRLVDGLSGLDLASLDQDHLNEVLDRFDPATAPGSPAGEQFLGSLIKKAKSVASFAVKTAAQAASGVAGRLVGIALQRLRALIRPLLKRVLSFAIGRLPEPLRAPARLVAGKLTGERDALSEGEGEDYAFSPAQATDVESLAESFDAALAEGIVGDGAPGELESFAGDTERDGGEGGEAPESRELEALAEARGQLIDTLERAGDGEDIAPAVEQFVPALLGALRVGINLVGRPRVVGFLAGYLAKLVGRWVGPQVAAPLSTAIVDTGLRLVSLEQPEAEPDREAVPAMLAATIEDTARRLAETEDYVLEDEDLMQLATAEAFERAVATNFPHTYVRPNLRRAPTLGGRFVTRRPRSARPYRRYNRMPEVELTAAIADRIPTFGGVTLAATLRAAGVSLPMKARLQIFEATVGTSLRRIAAIERGRRTGSRISSTQLHPLTPAAAGLLLREPGLGVSVAAAFLRSRQRVAAGQRFFYLEPLTAAGTPTPGPMGGSAAQRTAPSQGWILVDTAGSRIAVALYFSETDAQQVAGGVRTGRPAATLLPALTTAYDSAARSFGSGDGRVRILTERDESEASAGDALSRLMPPVATALRRALRSWLLPVLAEWTRSRAAEFVQAAANPASGVTVTITLSGVPGLGVVRDALRGTLPGTSLQSVTSGSAFRGTPSGAVTVQAGKHRP
ncbi:hypothetical protein [Glaciibacter sp. 2TAF33]|uniref:hypothetical protein n=1 Tax=Glaciibacter sp. 2TAF33 TaxID=3233015 RepID=UPI003F9159D3